MTHPEMNAMPYMHSNSAYPWNDTKNKQAARDSHIKVCPETIIYKNICK